MITTSPTILNILTQVQLCDRLFFVNKMCVRSWYLLDSNGNNKANNKGNFILQIFADCSARNLFLPQEC